MKKIILLIAAVVATGILAVYLFGDKATLPVTQTERGIETISPKSQDVEVLQENLNIPWEIEFLPNGEILITERPGTLLKIDKNGQRQKLTIEGVYHIGEGGLLGMALSPNFRSNNYIYLYYTYREQAGETLNRVVRTTLQNNTLSSQTIIVDEIPGAINHNGGRIAFGPDGYLYITTGDAGDPSLAQNTNSLAGKILRVTDNGSIPSDNPFNNAVYSYGHRNPQGLAWDNNGVLWATEHGRSGLQSGLDELNRIEKGGNYGWPDIQGNQEREGMITPVANSGPNVTWAPAGAVFWDGSIFFTGLRGASIYEAKTNGESVNIVEHFQNEFGRIRNVKLGPDNFFYILTSNTDGRGNARGGDDKLIKIDPTIFR